MPLLSCSLSCHRNSSGVGEVFCVLTRPPVALGYTSLQSFVHSHSLVLSGSRLQFSFLFHFKLITIYYVLFISPQGPKISRFQDSITLYTNPNPNPKALLEALRHSSGAGTALKKWPETMVYYKGAWWRRKGKELQLVRRVHPYVPGPCTKQKGRQSAGGCGGRAKR